jgi:hypothetical protein
MSARERRADIGASAPTPAPSSVAGQVPRAPAIDLLTPWTDPRKPDAEPKSHLEWAENIARLIARIKPFYFAPRSQEADDLVAVAQMTLVRLAPRFDFSRLPAGGDPNGLFRGWAHQHLRKECVREAERIRNGGTYNTTNEVSAKGRVGGIPDRCPTCAVVAGWGTGPSFDEDEDEPEPITTRHEPCLVILRKSEEATATG